MEVETFRIIIAEYAERPESLADRLPEIDYLEEARSDALDRLMAAQEKWKNDYDQKLPADHGIREGGLVLMFDSRYKDFPDKLHTRWLGPYKVTMIHKNGFVELEDLEGRPLETRVNGSRIKAYHAPQE